MQCQEEVRKYSAEQEFFIEEGCHINELSNSDNDQEVSIAKARVRPGVTTRWHRLNGTKERYVIIQGQGMVEIGDIKQQVMPYDTVVIPPDCRQRITNNGQTDLIFLAICSPRFVNDAYQDLENDK